MLNLKSMPVSMWSSGSNPEMARQLGLSYLHKYTAASETPEDCKRYLLSAFLSGQPMAYCLPTRDYHESRDWWEKYITERDLLNQSGIAFWYLHGEPKLEDVPHLKTVADLLHEIDPHRRPIISYHNDIDSVLTEMSKFLDGICFGAYPGCSPQFPRVRIARHIKRAQSLGLPVIAALECYNTPTGWTTPYQFYFDAVLSLICGAVGLCWYSYNQIKEQPNLLWAVRELAGLIRSELGEALLRGQNKNLAIEPDVRQFTSLLSDSMVKDLQPNPALYQRVIEYGSYYYILLANACQPEGAVRATITCSNILDWKQIYGNDQIEWLAKNKCVVTLQPLEAVIYRAKINSYHTHTGTWKWREE